jgi:hypothetical protein
VGGLVSVKSNEPASEPATSNGTSTDTDSPGANGACGTNVRPRLSGWTTSEPAIGPDTEPETAMSATEMSAGIASGDRNDTEVFGLAVTDRGAGMAITAGSCPAALTGAGSPGTTAPPITAQIPNAKVTTRR